MTNLVCPNFMLFRGRRLSNFDAIWRLVSPAVKCVWILLRAAEAQRLLVRLIWMKYTDHVFRQRGWAARAPSMTSIVTRIYYE